MTVTVFGIRHHGPGCARSLRAALAELEPDIVLVEGPPEGDPLLPLAVERGMQPPVALLIYRPDAPRRAAFYPFAVFSPEWQAIQYAVLRSIPIRFCDLPQRIQLAVDLEEHQPEAEAAPPDDLEERVHSDPIGLLAEAAGYADSELWWEEEVERRADAGGLFEAILEAMGTLRAETDIRIGDPEREAQREAAMRQSIRRAEGEGFQRIAAVCGAWHAPTLHHRGPAEHDKALLANLTGVPVEATWIPWTNFRLSYHSGYGAGITSPGWYGHLWTAQGNPSIGWVVRAAQLLRQERLEAPASGVIDAVRLAETLASLRERHNPGLEELRESILTVLCNGQVAPMQLIRERLEIGEVMGSVPAGTPVVPLQRDVEEQQHRLRLRPTDTRKRLDLDLRRDLDRDRSILLHRLRLLGVEWGKPVEAPVPGTQARRGGTFHELWRMQWQVEFPLQLIEMNAWGNTLLDAAEAFVSHHAEQADLPRLTELLHEATVAQLPHAISQLLEGVQVQSAMATEVRHLMDALFPLTQVSRYGDVRGTDVGRILPIIGGLFERVIVELPGACIALDDEAAAEMVGSMAHVRQSVALLDSAEMRDEWQSLLRDLAIHDGAHALIRGWCCRQMLEQGSLDSGELQRLAGLALSPGTPTLQAASWIEGLLRGSGLLLLQENGLWIALDGWLRNLDADAFTSTLPLLRRAFSGFQPPERRAMGEKVRRLHAVPEDLIMQEPATDSAPINRERAARVLPVLAHILGEDDNGHR